MDNRKILLTEIDRKTLSAAIYSYQEEHRTFCSKKRMLELVAKLRPEIKVYNGEILPEVEVENG